jgi:hypothetical protein
MAVTSTLSLNLPAITALCVGQRGSQIFAASGQPSNTNNIYGGVVGLSGDYYIDSSNGNYYGPKANTWPTTALFTLNYAASSLAFTLPNGYPNGNIIPAYSTSNSVVGNSLSILGGLNNSLSGSNSFILGSNITANISGFTLTNNISSTGIIYSSAGNSNQWSAVNTSVSTNSANWQNSYTTVSNNSAGWTTVANNSASWNSGYIGFTSLTANSANWQNGYIGFTSLTANSANWQNGYIGFTTLTANSGTWLTTGSASSLYIKLTAGPLILTGTSNNSIIPNKGINSNTASNNYSGILGGHRNTVTNSGYSNIIGGISATINGGNYASVVGGFANTITSPYASVVGGKCNTASGNYSFIAAGQNNNSLNQANTFILGSGLSATTANYTYVNNISSQGAVCAVNIGAAAGPSNGIAWADRNNSGYVNQWYRSAAATYLFDNSPGAVNSGNLIGVLSSGQVGIGVNPTTAATLTVAGTISASGNISASTLSAGNIYSTGNEVVFSDGYSTNDTGNGANTISLNFAGGAYVGLSGAGSLYALGVPVTTYLNVSRGAIGPGVTPFFATGDSLAANGVYEIIYELYYTKTTAEVITYTISGNNTFTNINANYVQTAVAGVTPSSSSGQIGATLSASSVFAALPATASLTPTGKNHYVNIKALLINGGTVNNTNIMVTEGTGTVTPLVGSYRKVTRIA